MQDQGDENKFLFGIFEKRCDFLSGGGELFEALQILADIRDLSDDDLSKDRVISLYSRFIKLKINLILQNASECKVESLVFWESIADSFIPFNEEFVSIREELTKHKEKAQWEALSKNKQVEQMVLQINALPEEARKKVVKEVKELLAKSENNENKGHN